jgi:hypothetical protein
VRAIDEHRNTAVAAVSEYLLDREHKPAAGRDVIDDH